jgi:ERCC4-related helicase
VLGHPKLEKLRDMVLKHFKEKEQEKVATRFDF